MLVMGDSSISFNAECLDATTQEHIGSMNASYSNGVIYFGLNLDKIDADMDEVKTDYLNFIDRIMTTISQQNNN